MSISQKTHKNFLILGWSIGKYGTVEGGAGRMGWKQCINRWNLSSLESGGGDGGGGGGGGGVGGVGGGGGGDGSGGGVSGC